MKTATRGNVAEAAILNALVERGFDVLVPFGGGQPYDLAVHLSGAGFLRVQCKTAWREKGCMLFNSLSTDHGRGPQPYFGLADIFGVYLPPTRAVYLVPLDAVPLRGRLRLDPTRNNQRRGIRFAVRYEIDRWNMEALEEIALTSAEGLQRTGVDSAA